MRNNDKLAANTPPRLPSGKKGQGLSLNTIIIGLIVLVVLVVIIAIFTASSGRLAENAGSCEAAGGKCVLASEGCEKNPFAKADVGNEKMDSLDVYCEPATQGSPEICCPSVINW